MHTSSVYGVAVCIALLGLAVGLRPYQFALGGASPARALTEPGVCPESHLRIRKPCCVQRRRSLLHLLRACDQR